MLSLRSTSAADRILFERQFEVSHIRGDTAGSVGGSGALAALMTSGMPIGCRARLFRCDRAVAEYLHIASVFQPSARRSMTVVKPGSRRCRAVGRAGRSPRRRQVHRAPSRRPSLVHRRELASMRSSVSSRRSTAPPRNRSPNSTATQ